MRVFLKTLSVFFMTFFLCLPAHAEKNYYSVTEHTSKEKYKMLTMTRFSDEDSCQETADSRNADMGEAWHVASSRCLQGMMLPKESAELFEQKIQPLPYLVFSDANGFANVVQFQNVPPVVVDAMVWKWSDALKAQNLKNVVVVMDANRQGVKNLIEEAKNRIAGKKDEPAEAEPKPSAPEVPKARSKQAFSKKDKLIFKNGQVLEGNLLERRKDGYWFQAEDGIELFFSDAEVQNLEQA